MADTQAEVVTKDAGGRERVHFSGLMVDAEQFVERNFPRPHIEPNSNAAPRADAFVRYEGKNYVYLGEGSGGTDDSGWHDADNDGNVKEHTTRSRKGSDE